MEAIDSILHEVDKLQPEEKIQLLHKLVDRMVSTPPVETTNLPDFNKYTGVGVGFWEVEAQTYINTERNEDRF